jgi:hypothetical protein
MAAAGGMGAVRVTRPVRPAWGMLPGMARTPSRAEQRWLQIEAAYERLQRDDPAGWAEYLAELAEWEAGTGGADSAATQEWPEYNR